MDRIERRAAPSGSSPWASAAWILWLSALVGLRAALVVARGTWAWSLQPLRFTPPALGWALWALAALALMAALARWQLGAVDRIEAWFERHPSPGASGFAALVAVAVALLPDRTWYVGDYLLRSGALESGRSIASLSPQSLPLDRLLHIDLPRVLAKWGWVALPAHAARALGAIEAAVLAWTALALGREISSGRGLALRFALIVLGGSGLALFTGYSKAAGDLCVLTLLFALGAWRVLRTGRGAILFSLAILLALGAHRSSLILLPAWATVMGLGWRGGRLRPRDARAWLATVAPIALVAAWTPRFARVFVGFDLSHHLFGPQVKSAGGPVGAALAPLHLIDVANLSLAYAPLAPLAALALVGVVRRPPGPDRAIAAALIALVVPALGMLLLVHPQQGLFRDWDVFAIPGTVLAVLSAALIAGALAESSENRRLSAALVGCAVLSAGLWMGQWTDTDRGLERALSFVRESPMRAPAERAKTWEFLGDRFASLGRWDEAAVALDQAIVDQPTPRLFRMLGVAEAQRGRDEAAEAAIFEAARRDPSDTTTWEVLITTAMTRRDTAMVRLAAEQLHRLSPQSPLAREALEGR